MAAIISIVTSAMGSVESAVASAKGALASLGLGLSVGYLVTLIKGSLDAMEHLDNLKKSTDLTAQELAGLNLVAKESGTNIDSVAKAFDRMSVAIGKDPEKFAALGITADTNKEKFKQLADMFNLLTDVNQRNALAQAIFKKSWDEIAPVLAKGGDEIGRLMDKGSSLSGITEENIARATEFNNKWVELTGTGGLLTRVTSELLPYLIQFIDAAGSATNKTESLSN